MSWQCYRALSLRIADLGLGVDAHKVQVFPAHLHQTIQIPVVVGAHRAVVGQPVNDVQLLQAPQPTIISVLGKASGVVLSSVRAVKNCNGLTWLPCMYPCSARSALVHC